eukprot:gene16515-11811_t
MALWLWHLGLFRWIEGRWATLEAEAAAAHRPVQRDNEWQAPSAVHRVSRPARIEQVDGAVRRRYLWWKLLRLCEPTSLYWLVVLLHPAMRRRAQTRRRQQLDTHWRYGNLPHECQPVCGASPLDGGVGGGGGSQGGSLLIQQLSASAHELAAPDNRADGPIALPAELTSEVIRLAWRPGQLDVAAAAAAASASSPAAAHATSEGHATLIGTEATTAAVAAALNLRDRQAIERWVHAYRQNEEQHRHEERHRTAAGRSQATRYGQHYAVTHDAAEALIRIVQRYGELHWQGTSHAAHRHGGGGRGRGGGGGFSRKAAKKLLRPYIVAKRSEAAATAAAAPKRPLPPSSPSTSLSPPPSPSPSPRPTAGVMLRVASLVVILRELMRPRDNSTAMGIQPSLRPLSDAELSTLTTTLEHWAARQHHTSSPIAAAAAAAATTGDRSVSLEAFADWFVFVFACLSRGSLRPSFASRDETPPPPPAALSPTEREQWRRFVSLVDAQPQPQPQPQVHRGGISFPRSLWSSAAFSLALNPFSDSPLFELPPALPPSPSPSPTAAAGRAAAARSSISSESSEAAAVAGTGAASFFLPRF